MSPKKRELHQTVFDSLDKASDVLAGLSRHSVTPSICRRPMTGGVFGFGRFYMQSIVYVDNSLHSAFYFVVEAESQASIGSGDTKQAAIEHARAMLTSCDPVMVTLYFGKRKAQREAAAKAERERMAAIDNERYQRQVEARKNVKSIGRRRKQIFEESGGKCHYCETVLTLDGKWHIEHKMPKALGGDNEPGNLVAACVPCNMKKRDTTDIEFKAKLAKEKAA